MVLFLVAVTLTFLLISVLWSLTDTFRMVHSDGANLIDKTVTTSGGARYTLDKDVANGVTNYQIECDFVKDRLLGVMMVSDKALTIKTNSGGAPDDTFTMTADVPMFWTTGMPTSNPFTKNVSALFVTNASGAQANLKGAFVVEPT